MNEPERTKEKRESHQTRTVNCEMETAVLEEVRKKRKEHKTNWKRKIMDSTKHVQQTKRENVLLEEKTKKKRG